MGVSTHALSSLISTWVLCASAATGQVVYTVSSTGDSVPSTAGSLRRAIEQSESDGQASRIVFAPTLFGQTIALFRPLPTILAGALELDGTNGMDTTPRITLTAMASQANMIGWPLRLDSNQNLVRGLRLQGFTFTNLQVTNAAQNVLEHLAISGGNIGVLLDGAADTTLRESTITFVVGVAVEVDSSQRCIIGPNVRVEDAVARSIDVDAACDQVEVRQCTVLRAPGVGIRTLAPNSILDGNNVQIANAAGIQVEGAGCSVRNNFVSLGRASGILVRNLPAGAPTEIGPGNTVEGNAFNGIHLQNAPRAVVRNNVACRDQGQSGIRLDGSPDAVLLANAGIDRNGQDGISVQAGCHRALVDHCTIGSSVGDGVKIVSSDDVVVSNCMVRTPLGHGVYVLSGGRAIIGPGNRLLQVTRTGVLCDTAATSARIDRNTISDPGEAGVTLLGPQGRANANQIDRAGSWGVRVQGASGCVVSENTIRDATSDGISVFAVTSGAPVVVGPRNTVERSGGQGLSLSQANGTRVVDNLAFRDNLYMGIRVLDSANVELMRNLEIAENLFYGIIIAGISPAARIEGNTVRANALYGIDIGPQPNHVLRNNTIRDHGNSALALRSAVGVLIERNRFWDNVVVSIALIEGCDNTRVLYNEIRGSSTGILDVGNSGNEIGWNAIYGLTGSGICLAECNSWVHDNLIYDNRLAGIETEGGFAGAQLVHNTIVRNGLGFFGEADIWNCIFSDNTIEWFPLSTTSCFGSLIGNDVFGFVGTNGNFSADPQLICLPPRMGRPQDTAHISRLSPCVNNSMPGAPRIATTDYDGDPRPAGSLADVGADEAVQSLGIYPPHVSQANGGICTLSLHGPPSRAGHTALVLASISGTGPFPLGSTLVPLGLDLFLILVLELSTTPLFPGFVGVLDTNGRHTAQFVVPPLAIPPEAIGIIDFTFAWIDLTTLDYASNPACVEIYP